MAQLKSLDDFGGYQRQLDDLSRGVESRTSKVLKHSNCIYGIEVESEQWGPSAETKDGLRTWWHFTGDGSLRGMLAMEAVSRPLKGTALVQGVRKLCRAINEEVEDAFTYRCSTHIHLNLLSMKQEYFPSLALTTILADNFLFQAAGGGRRGNYNCRSASVVMEEIEQLAVLSYHIAHNGTLGAPGQRLFGAGGALGERNRYMATNFAALMKFGSVEFRHFPGSQKANEILGWCDLVGDIYAYASKTKVDNVYSLANKGYKEFLKTVFPDEHRALTYREAEQDWAEAKDTAHHFFNTLAREAEGRGTFHGLLAAEYII